jgi:hypothetical protein
MSPVHALPFSSFKFHSNIILPSAFKFSKYSLSYRVLHQAQYAFLFPPYMPHDPPISPCLN